MPVRFPIPKLENDLLLRAINGLAVERVPVWMMRQAGRTDPAYRKIRERDGRPLEQLFRDVEQAIEISLLPQRIGVDAIIMFQDILTPLAPVGAEFRFTPGPTLASPIRTTAQVQALRPLNPQRDIPHVGEILQGIQARLSGALPVLGFAGAPVTLAFFMITGQSPTRQISDVLRFFPEAPKLVQTLLDYLTDLTIAYLHYQIESGAHAVQIFESMADVLPRELYEQFALPTHERIFASLPKTTPAILFAKEFSDLDLLLQSGAPILSVGSCVDLADARSKAPDRVFQGNVNNQLLADGTPETVTEAIAHCLAQTGGRNHILNLNHGLLERTPFEQVTHFVNTAKTLGAAHAEI